MKRIAPLLAFCFSLAQAGELSRPYDGSGANSLGVYTDSRYYIINNIWGVENNPELVFGVDYDQKIKFDENRINKNLSFEWDFPNEYTNPDANTVYSFPSISWQQPVPLIGWYAAWWSFKVKDIHQLHDTFDYEINDPDDVVSVLHDIWIYDETGVVNGELAIYTKASSRTKFWAYEYFAKQDSSTVYAYEGPFTAGDIIVSTHTAPNGRAGKNIQYYTDVASGKIDIDELVKFLNKEGHLPDNYSLQAIEFGAEIWMGRNTLKVNNFTIDSISTREMVSRIIKTLFGTEYISAYQQIGLEYLESTDIKSLIEAAINGRTDREILSLIAKNVFNIDLTEDQYQVAESMVQSSQGIINLTQSLIEDHACWMSCNR